MLLQNKVKFLLALTMLIFFNAIIAGAVKRVSVSANIANVRSEPKVEKSTFKWKVEKNYPVIVLEEQGNWYKIQDFENDIGWIHKSLISDYWSVVTIKSNCNIRSGAGEDYDIVFRATDVGVPLKVLNQKENWLYVEHADGDKGWIHKSLVW